MKKPKNQVRNEIFRQMSPNLDLALGCTGTSNGSERAEELGLLYVMLLTLFIYFFVFSLCFQLPGITLTQCRVKWKNLRHSFFRYEENVRRYGSGRYKPPLAYDLLCLFLSETDGSPGTAAVKGIKNRVSCITSDPTYDELPTTSFERTPKRRRLAPSIRPEGVDGLHAEILEEVRRSGRKMESLMEDLAQQQKVMIANQRELLKIEGRRNELLEEKLRLEKKRKQSPFPKT